MDREEKTNIAGEMRAMEVGEVKRFPIERHNTVVSAKYRGLLPERTAGADWKIKTNLAEKCTEVTRVS